MYYDCRKVIVLQFVTLLVFSQKIKARLYWIEQWIIGVKVHEKPEKIVFRWICLKREMEIVRKPRVQELIFFGIVFRAFVFFYTYCGFQQWVIHFCSDSIVMCYYYSWQFCRTEIRLDAIVKHISKSVSSFYWDSRMGLSSIYHLENHFHHYDVCLVYYLTWWLKGYIAKCSFQMI